MLEGGCDESNGSCEGVLDATIVLAPCNEHGRGVVVVDGIEGNLIKARWSVVQVLLFWYERCG